MASGVKLLRDGPHEFPRALTKLWRRSTTAEWGTLVNAGGTMAVAPNSRWLAASDLGCDGVRVYDLTTGRLHGSLVMSEQARRLSPELSFSPDSNVLTAAARLEYPDGHREEKWDFHQTVKLDLRSADVQSKLEPRLAVAAAAVPPSTRPRCEFKFDSGDVELIEGQTKTTLKIQKKPFGWAWTHAFSSDGTRLVVAGEKELQSWNVATKKQIWTVSLEERQWPSVGTVEFVGDDKTLLVWVRDSGRTGHLVVIEAASGKVRHTMSTVPSSPAGFCLSPDQRTLIVPFHTLPPRCWDLETGRELAVLREPDGAGIFGFNQTLWSPDSRTFLTNRSGIVKLWRVPGAVSAR